LIMTNAITIAAPRLPYHPQVQERFGVDQSTWRVLVESTFPGAITPEAVILALGYCKSRGLDPLKKMVHIVPVWDSKQKKNVETVWPSVAEMRVTAHRTKEYAGCDETVFGEEIEQTFEGKDYKGNALKIHVKFPSYAQVTVYRMVAGVRCPFPGPRLLWRESYGQRGKAEVPNDKWAKSSSYMIEKCAEAAALRKAFPEELGNDLAAEEMEGRVVNDAGTVTIDGETGEVMPAKPTRKGLANTLAKEGNSIQAEIDSKAATDTLAKEEAEKAEQHGGTTIEGEATEVDPAEFVFKARLASKGKIWEYAEAADWQKAIVDKAATLSPEQLTKFRQANEPYIKEVGTNGKSDAAIALNEALDALPAPEPEAEA